jgi:hypothetical protein
VTQIRVRLTPRAAREQVAASDGGYLVRVEGVDAATLRERLLA